MITFCFNDRAKAVDQDDLGFLMSRVRSLRGPGGKLKELGQPM
jgi:hypothetical protein